MSAPARWLGLLACIVAAQGAIAAPDRTGSDYVPGPGTAWERRAPATAGMDADALAAAVEFAKINETDFPGDFSTQEKIFGRPIGPVPASRAATNGIVLRHGYIVAEWGDTEAADPTYSVAKSFLSTLAGIAFEQGLIRDLDRPVKDAVSPLGDDGYDSPHNARITWAMHLNQTSEWEGAMWGKRHDFVGEKEFGQGQREPRELREPGSWWEYNDVRINRLALSLMRMFGRPLPAVLNEFVMAPIGASDTWRYHGYVDSTALVRGVPMVSVSGGTRWGGGLWISARDLARFGLLYARQGRWGTKQIVSPGWIKAATAAQLLGPDYGYLWWTNASGKLYPGAPQTSYAACGAGSNTVYVDPENDLVIVWRWHREQALDAFIGKVIAAIR
jgi:CubicO group peptidase (beta-lactamase class C family)